MGDSTQISNDQKGPVKKLSIFLSYGHDEFAYIARRLKKDLESRGHKVWFDEEKLKPGTLWEDYIQEGIEEVAASADSGRVVLLMTPHSVRRPNGFCLNELARAIDREITIIPVMLVQVEPPLCICRIQWFDARDCIPLEDSMVLYDKKVNQLLEAIEDKNLDFEGVTNAVSVVLKPFDFCKDIRHFNPHFTGRELLFNKVSNWLHDENAGRVFFITGELGIGLSSIAMMLYSKNPEIKAVHFCIYGDEDKCDTNRVVRSITHQLTTQLPGLLEAINSMRDLRKICENPSATTVFERLLVDTLSSGTHPGNEPIVILIDGLHEASHIDAKTGHRINEIAGLLSIELERLPKRIRFILTSLPVREVTVPLQKYKPFHIAARSKMNMEDIHNYLRNELKSLYRDDLHKLEEDVHEIAEKSEYLFLYLEKIKEEINGGFLTLKNIEGFPNGLGEFFLNYFNRQFKKDKPRRYYERTQRPVLEVITAAYEPISLDILSGIFNWGPYDHYKYQEDWGSLFPVIDNRVKPFHHSLNAWITDINKAGDEYIVEVSEGHEKLAKVGWREFQRNSENMLDYYKTHLLAHLNITGQKDKVQEYVTDCGVICNYYHMVRLYELSRFWKEIENDKLIRMCRASWDKELSNEKSFISLAARCIGRLFQNKGDFETALFYFNKELEFAKKKQCEVERAEALYDIAWCYRHIDAFDDSIKYAEDARITFEKMGFKSDVAKCLSVKGVSHWHLHEDILALQEIKEAYQTFNETNDLKNLAKALNHLGIIHRSLGQYTEAIRYLNEAKKIFDRLNDKKGLGKCLNSIGTCLWWSGDLDNAICNYNKANQINTEIDNQYVLGLTANNLGCIFLEKKEWLNAKKEFSKASDIRQKLMIESYYLMDLSGLAMVAYQMGDLGGAKKLSSKVFSDLDRHKMVEDLIRAYYHHYLIMKDGNLEDKTSAITALIKAKSLIHERIAKINDTEIRNSFLHNVPQVSEILSINEPGINK